MGGSAAQFCCAATAAGSCCRLQRHTRTDPLTTLRVTPRELLVGGRRARNEERYAYATRIHFLLDDRLGLLAGCGGTLISRSVVLTAGHVSPPASAPRGLHAQGNMQGRSTGVSLSRHSLPIDVGPGGPMYR